MLIEPGMVAQGTDGEIGTVTNVIADSAVDIFRGIVLSHGLLRLKQMFVPAEKVTGVSDRVVQVSLTKAEAEDLPPPSYGTSEA
jgi:hypothetical protein